MAQCTTEYIDPDLTTVSNRQVIVERRVTILEKFARWLVFIFGIINYLCALVGILSVATTGYTSDDFTFIAIFFMIGFISEKIAAKVVHLNSKVLKVIYKVIVSFVTFFSIMLILDCLVGEDPFEFTKLIGKISYLLLNGLLLSRRKSYFNK